MAGYAKNHVALERNPTTESFSKKIFAIDKFHFPNHVDANCHKNYNPGNVEQLKNVNTVICEQLFKGINQFKNCKSMNESHFFLFFLYNLDLHNLSKEGMICLANPVSEFRKTQLPTNTICFSTEGDETPSSSIGNPTKTATSGTNNPFRCPKCKHEFETEAWLKRHLNEKHPETDPKNPRKCPMCEKTLCNEQRLKTHIKTIHLTCKTCKFEFESQEEMMQHIANEHNKPCVCPTCDKVLTTQQRLISHMQTHLTCTVCKVVFESEVEMMMHKKQHTTCPRCSKDLRSLVKLKSHNCN